MKILLIILGISAIMVSGCKAIHEFKRWDASGVLVEHTWQKLTGLGKKKVNRKEQTFENDTGFKAGTPESLLSIDIGNKLK